MIGAKYLIFIRHFFTVNAGLHYIMEASITLYTVRKDLADFAVRDWWRYCKALCDVKFRKIEGSGRKFSHIVEVSKSVNS